jgi:hypothetical protein
MDVSCFLSPFERFSVGDEMRLKVTRLSKHTDIFFGELAGTTPPPAEWLEVEQGRRFTGQITYLSKSGARLTLADHVCARLNLADVDVPIEKGMVVAVESTGRTQKMRFAGYELLVPVRLLEVVAGRPGNWPEHGYRHEAEATPVSRD